jgi:hypothetical protein
LWQQLQEWCAQPPLFGLPSSQHHEQRLGFIPRCAPLDGESGTRKWTVQLQSVKLWALLSLERWLLNELVLVEGEDSSLPLTETPIITDNGMLVVG